MELWIRTQDKKCLTKVNHLYLNKKSYDFAKGYDIYEIKQENNIALGEYKTKERALEVLDEIQKFISEGGVVEFRESQIVGRMESYKKTVYEMPKE